MSNLDLLKMLVEKADEKMAAEIVGRVGVMVRARGAWFGSQEGGFVDSGGNAVSLQSGEIGDVKLRGEREEDDFEVDNLENGVQLQPQLHTPEILAGRSTSESEPRKEESKKTDKIDI